MRRLKEIVFLLNDILEIPNLLFVIFIHVDDLGLQAFNLRHRLPDLALEVCLHAGILVLHGRKSLVEVLELGCL